ncbi:hypothetical protein L873DRAFT_1785709 [Choiromyces venosus 120613-1]|uniref:Uncharacterized protein n=1 Tax=Choiromyces venosus 120613-1 TaxID=1336337 RepID=A0A3N4K859_9PEZI|nr:hypothetical protein L873DRAFT_1785709 [Choiromyces venosus 120613-1]
MPSHSLMPVRYVPESPRFQLSNGASYNLLASVPAKLQATMIMTFTSKSLLILKTDISTPRCLLTPIRHVPEFPRCRPSNSTFYVLLASVSAELQAAIQLVFTGESLLTLKTDISTSRCLLTPIRHVPESPRCRLSNGTSYVLLTSVSTKLQSAMQLLFTGESLLTLMTDISTSRCSLAPVRHVPEFP